MAYENIYTVIINDRNANFLSKYFNINKEGNFMRQKY